MPYSHCRRALTVIGPHGRTVNLIFNWLETRFLVACQAASGSRLLMAWCNYCDISNFHYRLYRGPKTWRLDTIVIRYQNVVIFQYDFNPSIFQINPNLVKAGRLQSQASGVGID